MTCAMYSIGVIIIIFVFRLQTTFGNTTFAPAHRPSFACPKGRNYPQHCPRSFEHIDFTTCCLTADNKPNCCKATSPQGRRVTICPKGYSMAHCPGKDDPDDLNNCCRVTKNDKAEDMCCDLSWVFAERPTKCREPSPLGMSFKAISDIAYWRNAVIALGVLLGVAILVVVGMGLKLCRVCD